MKKVLSILLVAVMAAAMNVNVFAATKYGEMSIALGYSYRGQGSLNGDTLDLEEIYAYDEVEIELPLCSDMFVAASGNTQPPTDQALSAADIRSSRIGVRVQTSRGSRVIRDVSIDARKSAVVVKFVKEWVSIKEEDFEAYVYLTINGKRQNNHGITLTGTMTNPVIEVYSDYDHVDLSDGCVADAQDFVNNIEVELGNGVFLFTKFFKGKKYYGTATRDIDEAADVVRRQYPDIDNVVTLKTVGLNSTGDVVKLDTDYSSYYVYDKDLHYLGQSNEMLPYSSLYYLANKKLDIDKGDEELDEDEDEEIDDEPDVNPTTGGDHRSNNANANPGTGC